ncbi:MAG TPA: hypothetical protein VHC20_05445 [Candidatus Paceibacterota bacterium]|nr:hypothetical protein [Candidatus Paceibacterota bacterium]
MLPQHVVVGYHGCAPSLAKQVVNKETELRSSANGNDWLGAGVYFWLDDSRRALHWAQKRAERNGEDPSQIASLGAVIDLKNCLNLADSTSLKLLADAHRHLQEILAAESRTLPENTGTEFANRKLDYAVFETLHDLRARGGQEAFDSVAGYFVEGAAVYAGAAFRALDHVQVCVRNPKCVLGYFLPRSE